MFSTKENCWPHTNSMNVTLNTRRKVVVDYLSYTFEVHTSGHHLRAHHDPAFSVAHTTYSIISLFLGHASMQTINVWYPIEGQLFRQRGSPRLSGRKNKEWWIVRLREIRQEAR